MPWYYLNLDNQWTKDLIVLTIYALIWRLAHTKWFMRAYRGERG